MNQVIYNQITDNSYLGVVTIETYYNPAASKPL